MNPAAGILFHDGQCIENGPVRRVVRAEIERAEQADQHRAVVRAVGAAHDRVQQLPVRGAGGLELPHEVPSFASFAIG